MLKGSSTGVKKFSNKIKTCIILVHLFTSHPQTAQVASMAIFWSDLFCPPDRISQIYDCVMAM